MERFTAEFMEGLGPDKTWWILDHRPAHAELYNGDARYVDGESYPSKKQAQDRADELNFKNDNVYLA